MGGAFTETVLLVLTMLASGCLAYNILVLAPAPSYSHQQPFRYLTKALLRRGHRVTFFTGNPLNISNENLTEIDLSVGYKVYKDIDQVTLAQQPPTQSLSLLRDPPPKFIPLLFKEPAVLDFMRRNHSFDLVVMEWFPYHAFYGLIHKVGSPPMVGVITLTPFAPIYYAMGNPMNPAYMPDVWIGYSHHMSFWERAYNAFFYLWIHYVWFYDLMAGQEAIMRDVFGPDPPSVYETERNYSLLIVNNHFCLEYPRPHLPNIIEIPGIHVKTDVEPLPKDIQEFLDGAEHGAVYFSLGSLAKSSSLPREKVQAFVEAFQELPQRVLWKWENESLPGQSANVMVSKWIPQQDVLRHPNVRLFIMQGGLQSMNEAAYHAVPFLIIPFFADQKHNAAKVEEAEIGLKLLLEDISKDTVLQRTRSILDDPKYRDNVRKLSSIFREHKAEAEERAVWWIEYVVRHKGAPHMRSAALDLYWWQLLLLDAIAFLLLAAAAIFCGAFFIVRRIIAAVKRSKRKHKKQ
ncbi:UDP-glucosyltransferase 2-like [Schistocerca serialis cubense]|uniref:UDP-glucosyltransferase 2-like n=1 Tax=Schistocerca serialis cubense TaxID=2023355 RepID=UPI00214F225C|nr:UDP-glucosyltransferase 2-like [Schistocerca serialis cubense]